MHESCCYVCVCVCVSVFVCVQALTERGRLDSLSFLTLLLAFHCCAANDASIHSPNTPFITIRPLLFLSLLISPSLSLSLSFSACHTRAAQNTSCLFCIFFHLLVKLICGTAEKQQRHPALGSTALSFVWQPKIIKKNTKIAKKNGKKKYKLWQMGANFNEIQQRKANKVNEEQARQRKEKRQHTLSHTPTHTARCQQRNIKKALTAKQG